MIVVIGLISCASEEECPLDNISGTHNGTWDEYENFGEVDNDNIGVIEVTLANDVTILHPST